jgi:FAD/FMN-containing dehydrogenase
MATQPRVGLERELARIVGPEAVAPATAAYLGDETEGRGLHGRADIVVLPTSAEQVARALAWCY